MKIKYLWLVIAGLILLAAWAAAKPGDVGRSPSLTDQYEAYNFMYFKAALPHVTVFLSEQTNSKNVGETDPCGKNCFQIVIYKQWNPDPKEESLTLLHEMVHVELTLRGVEEIDPHGPRFQAEMLRLAREGAFNALW